MMTVKELQKALKGLPDDLPVVVEIAGPDEEADDYASAYLTDVEESTDERTGKSCLFLSGEIAVVAEEEEEGSEAT
jgi:hypothetical protein